MAKTIEQIESVLGYRKDAIELKKWALEHISKLNLESVNEYATNVNAESSEGNITVEYNIEQADKLIDWLIK